MLWVLFLLYIFNAFSISSWKRRPFCYLEAGSNRCSNLLKLFHSLPCFQSTRWFPLFLFFFFLVVLVLELRYSHLLGRCSTTWATSQVLHYFSLQFFFDRPVVWTQDLMLARKALEPWYQPYCFWLNVIFGLTLEGYQWMCVCCI
jgi:hypothetical protein